MSTNENKPGVFRLYGCGGAGINIISSWDGEDGVTLPGGGLCKITYADTSRSNLPSNVSPEKVYLIDGVDGSGKVRAENHVEISRNVRSLLQKHEAGDLNIVCFSASGGSGSVFGPLLIAELIEQGIPVVGLVIGSEESNLTCKNTLNTLKSLEAIAQRKNVPVVINYHHNAAGAKRSEVDINCRYALATLSLLGNRRNHGLDKADLANWLNFPKVTSVKPQLAILGIYDDPAVVDEATRPIAIASLRQDQDQESYTVLPEYSCEGFPLEPADKFKQLHFVINTEGVAIIHHMLSERMGEAEKNSASRVARDSIVSDRDVVSETGLIL